MNRQSISHNREHVIYRYIRAVDAGDIDEIARILHMAETDIELNRAILDINQSYAEELGLAEISQVAETVRTLARQHLTSAFQQTNEDLSLTVSEVAARMVAERSIPTSDQEIGRRLMTVQWSLPELLSLAEIRRLAEKLRISASERFWKIFRETALQMTMGRGQAQMAAARRKRCTRYTGNSEEEDHAE